LNEVKIVDGKPAYRLRHKDEWVYLPDVLNTLLLSNPNYSAQTLQEAAVPNSIQANPAPSRSKYVFCIGVFKDGQFTKSGSGFRVGSKLVTATHVLQSEGFSPSDMSVAVSESDGKIRVFPLKGYIQSENLIPMIGKSGDFAELTMSNVFWALVGVKTSTVGWLAHKAANLTTLETDNTTWENPCVLKKINTADHPGFTTLNFFHNASTVSGDSGSPVYQGDKVVGVHLGYHTPSRLNYGVATCFLCPDIDQIALRNDPIHQESSSSDFSLTDRAAMAREVKEQREHSALRGNQYPTAKQQRKMGRKTLTELGIDQENIDDMINKIVESKLSQLTSKASQLDQKLAQSKAPVPVLPIKSPVEAIELVTTPTKAKASKKKKTSKSHSPSLKSKAVTGSSTKPTSPELVHQSAPLTSTGTQSSTCLLLTIPSSSRIVVQLIMLLTCVGGQCHMWEYTLILPQNYMESSLYPDLLTWTTCGTFRPASGMNPNPTQLASQILEGLSQSQVVVGITRSFAIRTPRSMTFHSYNNLEFLRAHMKKKKEASNSIQNEAKALVQLKRPRSDSMNPSSSN
jgi:hypothetical protein